MDDPDLERRFGALARLYGDRGLQRIRAAHVAVVGIGGVGSWTAEALARSAVGALTLIDLDHVAESNVNRQIHALTGTLGQAKTEAMRERITQINPRCTVHEVDAFVAPDNWPALLGGQRADAVVDACDQVAAKTAMAAWALTTQTRLICAGAAGGKRGTHPVLVDDLATVTHDRLLAKMRYQLRRQHGAPAAGARLGVACVFSREAAVLPDWGAAGGGGSALNCHGYGSSVAVTAAFGMAAAAWILERLAFS